MEVNNMVLERDANRVDELLDGYSLEGSRWFYIQGHEVDVVRIISTIILLAGPTAVNIGRYKTTGASLVACYYGGGRPKADMIEAERSDGEQMGGVAS